MFLNKIVAKLTILIRHRFLSAAESSNSLYFGSINGTVRYLRVRKRQLQMSSQHSKSGSAKRSAVSDLKVSPKMPRTTQEPMDTADADALADGIAVILDPPVKSESDKKSYR